MTVESEDRYIHLTKGRRRLIHKVKYWDLHEGEELPDSAAVAKHTVFQDDSGSADVNDGHVGLDPETAGFTVDGSIKQARQNDSVVVLGMSTGAVHILLKQ